MILVCLAAALGSWRLSCLACFSSMASFEQMDANRDGVISREEFMFGMLDQNQDGQISREEFAAMPRMGGYPAFGGTMPPAGFITEPITQVGQPMYGAPMQPMYAAPPPVTYAAPMQSVSYAAATTQVPTYAAPPPVTYAAPVTAQPATYAAPVTAYGAPLVMEGTTETVAEPMENTVSTLAATTLGEPTPLTTNTLAPQPKAQKPMQTMMGTTTQVKMNIESVKDSAKAGAKRRAGRWEVRNARLRVTKRALRVLEGLRGQGAPAFGAVDADQG